MTDGPAVDVAKAGFDTAPSALCFLEDGIRLLRSLFVPAAAYLGR